MKFYSPLRYPGSKRKLINYLDKILFLNKLAPKVVVEPFVGGGSVSLAFLMKKDELISSFWETLFFDTDFLVNFVKNTTITPKRFNFYKKVVKNHENYDKRQLAKACLFLNRTSFSGILQANVGPLGGREQQSKYKIDCRFGRKNLVKRIKEIAAFRNKVTVLSSSWAQTIKYCLENLKYKTQEYLFYLDPPFYEKADYLYRYYFDSNDHETLRDEVVKLKQPWILSYDRASEIKKLYSEFKRIHIQMPYSINSPSKRIEKELIITPLKLPKIKK
jgi:DNA adenine methylase